MFKMNWGRKKKRKKKKKQRKIQFSSVAQLCPTFCDPMNHSMTGLPVHHQLPESTQSHVHWVGDAIQPSHPLSSPSPPALNLSQHQGLFKWVNSSPKYWSFSFNISPSSEYPGLISFRMDWLDLLTVQGTLRSLLQHHSSKASLLQCSAFFIIQLSHPYMTTGKTGGQNIGTSASASVLPMNIQGWFPLGLSGLISLLSRGPWRVLSCTSLKTSILRCPAFFMI